MNGGRRTRELAEPECPLALPSAMGVIQVIQQCCQVLPSDHATLLWGDHAPPASLGESILFLMGIRWESRGKLVRGAGYSIPVLLHSDDVSPADRTPAPRQSVRPQQVTLHFPPSTHRRAVPVYTVLDLDRKTRRQRVHDR
jgi:hypothetical protein